MMPVVCQSTWGLLDSSELLVVEATSCETLLAVRRKGPCMLSLDLASIRCHDLEFHN